MTNILDTRARSIHEKAGAIQKPIDTLLDSSFYDKIWDWKISFKYNVNVGQPLVRALCQWVSELPFPALYISR